MGNNEKVEVESGGSVKKKNVGTVKEMYSFADSLDYQLMFWGVILSLIQAILPPFVWLIMGDFVTISIYREELNFNKTRELEDIVRYNLTHKFNKTQFTNNYEIKKQILDNSFETNATPVFLLMLTLSLSTFFAAFLSRYLWEVSGARQSFKIKRAYVRKLLYMDVAWLESKHSGEIASMLSDQTDQIHQGIADHMPMVIFIFSYLIVTVSVCFYIQWDVTLVMFIALPLLIGSRIIFSKWFCKTMDEEVNLQNKMTNLVKETFELITTVISLGGQKQTLMKYEKLSIEHNKYADDRLTASSVYDALTQVLVTEIIFTLALCYGMWRVGQENPGRLAALAINILYIKKSSHDIQRILSDKSVIEVDGDSFDDKRKIKKKTFSDIVYPVQKVQLPKEIKINHGEITLKNISFAYPSRPEYKVLKNLNLIIPSGSHIGICGCSGSGKSTIAALLLRFYDPTEGEIQFDGIDIRKLNPNELRKMIGVVSQEPVLFDGTISDNIVYGKLDATQNEINEAARKGDAWQFISALPQGFHEKVGYKGGMLSGGQKQRIAIARAVIRNPKLLIFDEATSALDFKHETDVQKAIEIASKGITTITIAHRLNTLKNMDRIIVMNDGEIVEDGTPDELMKAKGKYFRMFVDHKVGNFDLEAHMIDKGISRSKDLRQKYSIGSHEKNNIVKIDRSKSNIGERKRIGRSYSMISTKSENLAMPITFKRNRFNKSMRGNIVDLPIMENEITILEDEELPGKITNLKAIGKLIFNYKEGFLVLLSAIPLTILRGIFYLLVCFEVASVLETALYPDDEKSQGIFNVGSLYIALIIIKTIFEALGRLNVAKYGHGFCNYLRYNMLKKLLRHGESYFDEDKNTPGRLVYKLINETAVLNRILSEKIDLLIPAIVCSFTSISIAIFINWKLALLCSFQFPAFFFFRLIEFREANKRQKQMLEEERKVANLAHMVLSNICTIKAYNLQGHFKNIFDEALKSLERAIKYQSIIGAIIFACQFSFSYIMIAITLYFGKDMMIKNEIDPFNYLRVVLLTQFGANFISQLIASVTDISKARLCSEHILEVLTEKAADMDNMSDEGFRPMIVGRMKLEDIEFRYPSRPIVPILKNLNITFGVNEKIAIIGSSGCGKSTILSLLQRLYIPTKGNVMLDNYNIKTINPQYLRRCIVSVMQEPALFSFTIKENITFGIPEEYVSMDKVIEAAKLANIHDFIIGLPNGYDTNVGEYINMSGGEKQRIAIARALFREPKVLLLDEATSALDSISEKAVQKTFEDIRKRTTCIHVTHKLSSVVNADKIIVLINGQVGEEGTHQELMKKEGFYYEMVMLQKVD
uniref:ABC transporter family protein n=1 Tax=Strongyloides papillosus TaxID=174720 RepID=A0A0N5CHS2_STREA